jgi:RNA polymerase sigma-70 factor (ECF subfamily)
LYAYLGDLAEAQDVVQEAYCKAYAAWRRVSRDDDPVAWVRRAAWNLATKGCRAPRRPLRGSRQVRVEPERLALVQALATISHQQRRAVVLRHLAQMSVAEIAAQEGESVATVTAWLVQGQAKLAERLGDASATKSTTNQKGN